MIVLIDIGNTRVKWQTRAAGQLVAEGVLPTAQLPAWRPDWAGQPALAVVSNVAADWVIDGLSDKLGLSIDRVHVVESGADTHGIVSEYRGLGSDRFLAMVAAHRRGFGDCLVVSAGTAFCADMLTSEGRFLGGCIVPGPDLMRASLSTGTARAGSQASQTALFPTHTDAAVATGIALALCGLVESLESRLRATTGRLVRRVLTGGARAVLVDCHGEAVVEIDNLVLEGLAWIARDLGYAA